MVLSHNWERKQEKSSKLNSSAWKTCKENFSSVPRWNRFNHDNSTPPLLQAVHCRLRCLCALLSVGREGHRHVRRTFASFRNESGDIKHNHWMCLPNPCYAVARPLRGDFSLYTPQRSPYTTQRKETGWKNCRNRNRCLSLMGLSRLSRWPLHLLPSNGKLLYTANLKAIFHYIYLSISCLPQGPYRKACLELAKHLSSGNLPHFKLVLLSFRIFWK